MSFESIVDVNRELFIIYVDDEPSALKNFSIKVNHFNTDEDNPFAGVVKLRIQTTSDYSIAEDMINEGKIKICICDHNMPQQTGIQFINYLKEAFPNVVYVIYTGAGNVSADLVKECKKEGILLFSKSEQFSTIIEKIVSYMQRSVSIPERKGPPKLHKLYSSIAKDITEDMERAKQDPEFIITIGNKDYTPSDIISELNQMSDFAVDYLLTYIEGLKFFKKIKSK